MRLYEISARYEQLLNQEDYTEEELKELEGLHGNVEDELIDRGKYIKNLKSLYNSIKNEIIFMTDRHDKIYQLIELNEERLAHRMLKFNINKITKNPFFSINLYKNPVSIIIDNEELIPEEYISTSEIIKKSVDKFKIRNAIKEGKDVPGTSTICQYRIKFK